MNTEQTIDPLEIYVRISEDIRTLETQANGGNMVAVKYLHNATGEACRASSMVSLNHAHPINAWDVLPLANNSLKILISLSKGRDRHAFTFLHQYARNAILALNDIANGDIEFLVPYTKGCNLWPMLVGPSASQLRIVKRRLNDLRVGTDTPYMLGKGGKLPDLSKTPYKQFEQCLSKIQRIQERYDFNQTIKEIEKVAAKDFPVPPHLIHGARPSPPNQTPVPKWAEAASRLPELKRSTAHKWFKFVWIVLMEQTNGHPENDPELRALGKVRGEIQSNDPIRPLPKGTRDARIRNGIKTRLKRDFKLMIRN